MKKTFAAILAVMLIACCLGAALADSIRPFESPTWVRTGPGLSYPIIDRLYVGNTYSWGGSIRTDSRGVDWYDVYYTDDHGVNGYGWASSLQADLVGGGSSYSAPPSSSYSSSSRSIHPYEQPTWVRTGAGLDYPIIDKIFAGLSYTWGGNTRTDNRGVSWYDVYYTDNHGVSGYGWVSSLQADLY